MKMKHKNELTFGNLIKASYQVWGPKQAEKMVRWAINSRLMIFRDHPYLLISSAKERHV
jgi:hypothetical protein